MLAPLIFLLMMQADPVRNVDASVTMSEAPARAFYAEKERVMEAQRTAVAARYNRLIQALQAFTSEYNGSQGQVWPAKKAEAVRKAFREFERTMPGGKAEPNRN